jgi:DNA-directed RNA polymerase specialized sigma24 family protein
MTDEDAQKVKFGELKDLSHREAAKELGLSYGQVYSCRLGYTFNHITK